MYHIFQITEIKLNAPELDHSSYLIYGSRKGFSGDGEKKSGVCKRGISALRLLSWISQNWSLLKSMLAVGGSLATADPPFLSHDLINE